MEQRRVFFSSFGVLGLLPFLKAGLLDSLTPCTFTALVFFVALFYFVSFKKQEIAVLGICFVLSVFLTNIFVELGTFEPFRNLELFSLISKSLYLFIGFLAVILGLFNLSDWWSYLRFHDPAKFIIKTPMILESKSRMADGQIINQSLKEKTGFLFGLGFAAVVSGFFIALLKSTCQGQLYLPVFVSLFETPAFKMKAITYVILYSLLSVFPFFLVLFFILSRASLRKLAKVFDGHVSKFKIISAAVFLGLGFGLIFMFGDLI